MTSRPVDTPMTSTAGKRSWRRAGIRLGGSALVLTLLFVFLPLQELLTAIRRVPAGLWLLVLASYLGTHALGVAKWRLLVNLAGGKLTLIQAVRCYFAGLFGSVFLPSLVGGDVIRVGLALRYSRNRAGVFLGSLIDRILDVTAMAALASVGAVLLPQALNPQGRAIFWGLALIFLILAFTTLGLLSGLISLLVGKFFAVVPGPTASMAILAEDRLAIPRS